MASAAAVKAFEDIHAAIAVLAAEVEGAGEGSSPDGDPLRESADDCLDILAGVPGAEARMAALKARAAAKFSQNAEAMASPVASAQALEMSVTAEIACVLTIGSRAAGALLNQSQVLTTMLPLTLAALEAGSISWQHARVMVEETACLDPDGAGALEAHFLDPDAPSPARGCPAGEMPAARFRAKARNWRERHQAESIERRHARSALDRRVEYAPDKDGMAWLSAYLPADTAENIWNRTTAIARGLQGPEEDRTLTQLRADALATALLSSGNGNTGTGLGDVPRPGRRSWSPSRCLPCSGLPTNRPCSTGTAPSRPQWRGTSLRTAPVSFYRVLVDPRDGAPLEIGRKSYRLTKAMRKWLRLRDGKCPFPGCSNQSLDNEADHILAWAGGGTTGISNLGQPCPAHRRLRHTSTWTPTPATKNEPPGWVSPSGRRYKSECQDWEPPRWPQELKPGLPAGAPRQHPKLGQGTLQAWAAA